ncbi:hypothetical protein PT974_10995 [Cladobotryum mycophilum]|uniref:Protein HRI1 n=1 Tax=Cladobotryum mycophilum TaxID=491253 RepID=A0ABR0SBK8_9HYPO
MGSISIRKYIQWLPKEASEPTSTLVLTSPERRYVDIRVLLPINEDDAQKILPLERLDWAIAGFSSSTARDDGQGGQIFHSNWRHWIDSRHKDAEAASDEGDNHPRPDGLTLEKGSMVNPATGRDTAYEELWYDPDPKITPPEEKVVSLVLMWEESEVRRGMVVRVGEYCQGFVRDGDELAAERWAWREGGGGWERVVKIGSERELPCAEVLNGTRALKLGDEILRGKESWKVVEIRWD